MPGRALILTGLALCVSSLAPFASRPQEVRGEPAPHETIDRPALESCGGCHAREYEEWSRSLHAGAWTNPNVRNATRGFRKLECRPCHSPRSVFETGFERAPALRDFNHEDGVHCLSCHGLTDGVAAARTIPGAPCRPRAEPRLLAADHCYPCHQPTHQAFDEYRTSQAFRDGTRCADCHMPEREDGSGHSHGPNGGLSEAFVQRAIEWTARIEGRELVLTLTNRTGHKFPGEIPSRSFLARVHVPGHEPTSVLLRKPHKGEDRADDRLLPDETRDLRFSLPADALEARVELTFLPLPLLAPAQGFGLGEWSGRVE